MTVDIFKMAFQEEAVKYLCRISDIWYQYSPSTVYFSSWLLEPAWYGP